MKSVNYTKQLEVAAEYDVIVAGSGPAGIDRKSTRLNSSHA